MEVNLDTISIVQAGAPAANGQVASRKATGSRNSDHISQATRNQRLESIAENPLAEHQPNASQAGPAPTYSHYTLFDAIKGMNSMFFSQAEAAGGVTNQLGIVNGEMAKYMSQIEQYGKSIDFINEVIKRNTPSKATQDFEKAFGLLFSGVLAVTVGFFTGGVGGAILSGVLMAGLDGMDGDFGGGNQWNKLFGGDHSIDNALRDTGLGMITGAIVGTLVGFFVGLATGDFATMADGLEDAIEDGAANVEVADFGGEGIDGDEVQAQVQGEGQQVNVDGEQVQAEVNEEIDGNRAGNTEPSTQQGLKRMFLIGISAGLQVASSMDVEVKGKGQAKANLDFWSALISLAYKNDLTQDHLGKAEMYGQLLNLVVQGAIGAVGAGLGTAGVSATESAFNKILRWGLLFPSVGGQSAMEIVSAVKGAKLSKAYGEMGYVQKEVDMVQVNMAAQSYKQTLLNTTLNMVVKESQSSMSAVSTILDAVQTGINGVRSIAA